MDVRELKRVLKEVIDNENKVEHGEFTIEFFSSIPSGPQLDLTSAVLTHSGVFSGSDNELCFSRFLSGNFAYHPFVLVSKMRKMSVTDDNQKSSKPTGFRGVVSNSPQKEKVDVFTRKQDTSEVWGSPLKCNIPAEDESVGLLSFDSSQMSLSVKKPRPKHLGIPLNLARKIISTFNTSRPIGCEFDTDLPSMLVLCDGRDLHSTALFGVKPFQVSKTEGLAKGLKTVKITVDEKGNFDTWNAQVKMGAGLSQTCQAVYQVNAGNVDKEKPWGTVAVEIKWRGASRLLETPPTDASTAVKASVQSGNLQSSMNAFYQELQFLGRIITAVTTGQVEWVSTGSDKATIPLTASVKNLIETLQEEGTLGSLEAQADQQAESWSFATALKTFSIPERKDYDFTDRLWKVLLDCMSTDDLVSCLRLTFRELGHGQLRPFVDRHNQTIVAQMVRESFTGHFSAPSLTGVQPFLFLAEMGAEKLRRDYIHIFVSQCLATPSALESFTSTEQELNSKLDDLNKLHSVLEMVTLLGASLRLPSDTLGIIARQMLSHYHSNPVNPQHVFSFPVKTSEVRYVLSSIQPVMWCVETTSKVSVAENVHETSLHCLSMSQPFFHLQARTKGSSVSEESKENNSETQDIGVELSPLEDLKGDYCLVQRKESVIIL